MDFKTDKGTPETRERPKIISPDLCMQRGSQGKQVRKLVVIIFHQNSSLDAAMGITILTAP